MAKASATDGKATRQKVSFDLSGVKVSKASEDELVSTRTRSKSAERQQVDTIVSGLNAKEVYRLPIPGGEDVRKAFIVHLRNSVKEIHSMGVKVREDGDTVIFRMRPPQTRKSNK